MTHYDENSLCFKFHVTMSMYVLLKMTKIKSTKYHNLIMIKHELWQQIQDTDGLSIMAQQALFNLYILLNNIF